MASISVGFVVQRRTLQWTKYYKQTSVVLPLQLLKNFLEQPVAYK
jgi:hypothetical protein